MLASRPESFDGASDPLGKATLAVGQQLVKIVHETSGTRGHGDAELQEQAPPGVDPSRPTLVIRSGRGAGIRSGEERGELTA
jgi:hypothetical protein